MAYLPEHHSYQFYILYASDGVSAPDDDVSGFCAVEKVNAVQCSPESFLCVSVPCATLAAALNSKHRELVPAWR